MEVKLYVKKIIYLSTVEIIRLGLVKRKSSIAFSKDRRTILQHIYDFFYIANRFVEEDLKAKHL